MCQDVTWTHITKFSLKVLEYKCFGGSNISLHIHIFYSNYMYFRQSGEFSTHLRRQWRENFTKITDFQSGSDVFGFRVAMSVSQYTFLSILHLYDKAEKQVLIFNRKLHVCLVNVVDFWQKI